jgi:hypothetical protein
VADQVRVNVELINAQTDSDLWAESYDRAFRYGKHLRFSFYATLPWRGTEMCRENDE